MKANGFTLLESIVALVILSAVGISVLSWVSQSSLSVSRLLEREQDANLQKNVVALAGTINPVTHPRGQLSFGAFTISWTTLQQKPLNAVLDRAAMLDQDLSIYTLQFNVADEDGNSLLENFQVDQPGYKREVVQP